jgi:hypothetical protein
VIAEGWDKEARARLEAAAAVEGLPRWNARAIEGGIKLAFSAFCQRFHAAWIAALLIAHAGAFGHAVIAVLAIHRLARIVRDRLSAREDIEGADGDGVDDDWVENEDLPAPKRERIAFEAGRPPIRDL